MPAPLHEWLVAVGPALGAVESLQTTLGAFRADNIGEWRKSMPGDRNHGFVSTLFFFDSWWRQLSEGWPYGQVRKHLFDNHATTAVDPRVAEAMWPYVVEISKPRLVGTWMIAKEAVQLLGRGGGVLGATPKEVIFTSGATESTNLAIVGAARANAHAGKHLILSTEHKATWMPVPPWSARFEVTVLPVQANGLVDLELLQSTLRNDTLLVSVLMANNEIGVLQPVNEIGEMCRERGILFNTDVAQATGKVEVDVQQMKVDLVSVTAHKMHGPKGLVPMCVVVVREWFYDSWRWPGEGASVWHLANPSDCGSGQGLFVCKKLWRTEKSQE